MNELVWDRHARQECNKIPPPTATDCTRSVSAMIASVLTTANWHEPDSKAVACIRTSASWGRPGNLRRRAQNS